MIQMKKKLLAVVLAVVMIAALIVPMMAISAADAPTATIGLGTPYKVTRTKNNLTKDCIAIDVLISGNGTTQGFFTARYAVISEEGLEHYYAPHANAAKSDKGADLGDFTDGDATLPIDAGQLSGEGKTWFQVVHLSDKAYGVYKDSGKLVTVYFVLPEKVGTYNGCDVVDDYAHHPTEIRATLTSAKSMNYNKIWTVFQPHTYTRTKSLLDDFAEVLPLSDNVIIADVYPAREAYDGTIHSCDLAAKIPGSVYINNMDAIVRYLKANATPGDLIIAMGAGDINKIAYSIIDK